ncbi:hypothetical protein ACTA71_007467 [Dictyostelium dimigraforme]
MLCNTNTCPENRDSSNQSKQHRHHTKESSDTSLTTESTKTILIVQIEDQLYHSIIKLAIGRIINISKPETILKYIWEFNWNYQCLKNTDLMAIQKLEIDFGILIVK